VIEIPHRERGAFAGINDREFEVVARGRGSRAGEPSGEDEDGEKQRGDPAAVAGQCLERGHGFTSIP
jgi:hypothetical protein